MEQNKQFERIYAETRDDLLRFFVIRTNASPETEDLLQETYCRLFIRMMRGFIPIINYKRFLFSIAKKVLAKYYRSISNRKTMEQPLNDETLFIADEEDVDERLFVEDQKERIWRLIQVEPEMSRRAFILFYGYERSQKEIGEALGISEEAVRQRLYRTRRRIRLQLKNCNNNLQ